MMDPSPMPVLFRWLPSETGDRLYLDGWPIEIRSGHDGMALFVAGRQDCPWTNDSLRDLKARGEMRVKDLALKGIEP